MLNITIWCTSDINEIKGFWAEVKVQFYKIIFHVWSRKLNTRRRKKYKYPKDKRKCLFAFDIEDCHEHLFKYENDSENFRNISGEEFLKCVHCLFILLRINMYLEMSYCWSLPVRKPVIISDQTNHLKVKSDWHIPNR